MIFGQKKNHHCGVLLFWNSNSLPLLQSNGTLSYFFNFLKALLRAQIYGRVLIGFVQLGSIFYIIMLILCAQKMSP